MEEKRVEEMAMELPAGFRFHPTDEELISYYLYPKVLDSNFSSRAIGDVDLNKCEPWELPKMAKMGEEKELYFFCVRDRKYPTGMRTNRATESGYWKATGKDKEISRGKSLVGMKKTLVFYKGRAPKGEKSNWVMHEFRLEGILSPQYLPSSSKHEWVICRVFEKNNSSAVGGKKNFSYSESQLVMRMKSEDDQLLGMDDDDDDSCSFEFNHSSSLPPLMDPSSPSPSYYCTAKLPPIGPVSVAHDGDDDHHHHHQYVSCFSNNMTNPLQHQHHQYYDPYPLDGPHFLNNNSNFTNPYPSYLSQSKDNYNTSYPIRGAAAAAGGAGSSSSSSSQYPSFDAVSIQDNLVRSILDSNSNSNSGGGRDHMPSAGAHNTKREIFRGGGVTTATTMSVSQDTCLSTDIINSNNREISSSYQMISSCGGRSLLNWGNEEEEGPSTSDCSGGGLIDIDSFWSY